MQKRFASIWFRYLKTDWHVRRQAVLGEVPFVLITQAHGRMLITSANALAQSQGITIGMALADAKVIITSLQFFEDKPELPAKLLHGIAEWCIRYTPVVAVDLPDGLILDITGCAHLWGGEKPYLAEMHKRLKNFGYDARIGIADTIGAAWATARFGHDPFIVESGHQKAALLPLPASSLRLETEIVELLQKLGLHQVGLFINIPRPSLRRRFGKTILIRLDQAIGTEEETIIPVNPVEPYLQRLPCMEPIATATGIAIALQNLLESLCQRLQQEGKGLRFASFKCYRLDGKIEQIDIGTNRPSRNRRHIFKLFEIKIETIEPALGIELFTLEAKKVEDLSPLQEKLFKQVKGLNNNAISELLDRIGGKFGEHHILRYVPNEHYWPERSFKLASSLNEELQTHWKINRPRPLQILPKPEPIEVTAPVPDYPPMNFRYLKKLHKITRADGPERIEQEWWLEDGQHRDYYYVEDEEGYRYWLFRLGHYETAKSYKWFIHGFFA